MMSKKGFSNVVKEVLEVTFNLDKACGQPCDQHQPRSMYDCKNDFALCIFSI